MSFSNQNWAFHSICDIWPHSSHLSWFSHLNNIRWTLPPNIISVLPWKKKSAVHCSQWLPSLPENHSHCGPWLHLGFLLSDTVLDVAALVGTKSANVSCHHDSSLADLMPRTLLQSVGWLWLGGGFVSGSLQLGMFLHAQELLQSLVPTCHRDLKQWPINSMTRMLLKDPQGTLITGTLTTD
jgi:hypothetical protein